MVYNWSVRTQPHSMCAVKWLQITNLCVALWACEWAVELLVDCMVRMVRNHGISSEYTYNEVVYQLFFLMYKRCVPCIYMCEKLRIHTRNILGVCMYIIVCILIKPCLKDCLLARANSTYGCCNYLQWCRSMLQMTNAMRNVLHSESKLDRRMTQEYAWAM
jgi:hypothetical protein